MSAVVSEPVPMSGRHRVLLCAASLALMMTIAIPESAEAAGTGRTIGSGPVTVYAQPFTSSMSLGTIALGVNVTVECAVRGGTTVSGPYGPSNIWHNIKFNNRTAWIPDAFLFTRSSFLAPGEVECKSGRVDTLGGGAVPVWSTPTSGVVVGTIPNGTSITLYCGANGSSSNGKWGARTLWHMVGVSNRWGYVPDASVNTGVEGLPRTEYWCPSTPATANAPTPAADKYPVTGAFATARDENGRTNVGQPSNSAHTWGAGTVQDFDKGAWGQNIIMRSNANPSRAFVVRTGFWDWYRANNNQGMQLLGYPLTNEFAYGTGARQGFQKGVLEWKSGRASKVDFAAQCATNRTFSCLERFGYSGADTGTWADKYHNLSATGNHNCTRFVAYYMAKYLGFRDPGAALGNAKDWGGTTYPKSLKSRGYLVDSNPAVGAVAWWDKSNHVGVVVGVGPGYIIVASDNADFPGFPQGASDVRKLTPTDDWYPKGFIHVENGPRP